MRFLLLVGALCFVASTATAKEIYVSGDTGSDDNPGTKDKPKKLLWKTLGEYAAGDVIRVAEGFQHGQQKAGVMPNLTASVVLEGGWKKDFSERDPFKYLTIITAGFDRGGATSEVFRIEDRNSDVTIDGFMIDRGGGTVYFSDGEMGANKRIEGHSDCTPFAYRNENKKMSGSDPSIELIGRNMTVRNNIIINSPWWGIYVKGGGDGTITIENNMVLGFQGRGIEAIVGGGWGKPKWVIRNNTIAFGWEMEGRGLSIDPKDDNGKYLIEKNVIAFTHQTGVMAKFQTQGDIVTLTNNLFFMNRLGDWGHGGSGCCNAGDLDDEVKFKVSKNVHELPKFIAKINKQYFDRYSMTQEIVNGAKTKDEELLAARKSVGLGDYAPIGFDKTYTKHAELPNGRTTYDNSRFPTPMKVNTGLDAAGWVANVLPLIGQDGERGIQAKFVK